jgi:hypothetical protein
VRSTHDALVFEFTLRTGPQRGGSPSLRGPAAQGPPAARFIYVNSGRQAGDDRSGWDRRAKVSLESITAKLLAAWRRTPGATLEARIAGTGPDGGPACATIALLGRGWELSA